MNSIEVAQAKIFVVAVLNLRILCVNILLVVFSKEKENVYQPVDACKMMMYILITYSL